MKATQKQPRQLSGFKNLNEYGMSIQLDAEWGTLDVDVVYLVHDGSRDSPQLFELVGVWLGSWEISHHLNIDYILDLCADDYLGRQQ